MIQINDVSFRYSEDTKNILENFHLTVEDGEFLCVIGHSGCGKSTLLRLVAGLDFPQKGEILVDGETVRSPAVERSIVFQQYSLFPWLTVKKNVLFALKKTKKYSKEEAEARAELFLSRTGLAGDMDKYPYQLSGGMRQRTAIARALAVDSPFLLLDEPFGALDTKIRKELQSLLKELWENADTGKRKTVIFVTHDLEEAMIMGSRIVLSGMEKYVTKNVLTGISTAAAETDWDRQTVCSSRRNWQDGTNEKSGRFFLALSFFADGAGDRRAAAGEKTDRGTDGALRCNAADGSFLYRAYLPFSREKGFGFRHSLYSLGADAGLGTSGL